MSKLRFESDGTALGTKILADGKPIQGLAKFEFIIEVDSPVATIRFWMSEKYKEVLKEKLGIGEPLDERNIVEIGAEYEFNNFSGYANVSIEVQEPEKPEKKACSCGNDPCRPHEHKFFDPNKDI